MIFSKLRKISKIAKKVKAIKKYLAETHIDEELKELIEKLKQDFDNLSAKIPDVKGVFEDLLELIK